MLMGNRKYKTPGKYLWGYYSEKFDIFVLTNKNIIYQKNSFSV